MSKLRMPSAPSVCKGACLGGLLALAVALHACALAPVPPPPGRTSGEEAAGKLAEARSLHDRGRYRQAIEKASPLVAAGGETAAAARDLLNASHMGLGRALEKQGDYPAALRSYRSVDRGYRGAGEAVAGLERRMDEESEAHYIAGVRHFVNQEIDLAIAEFEKALAVNPGHSRAARDLEKALRLREELQRARQP